MPTTIPIRNFLLLGALTMLATGTPAAAETIAQPRVVTPGDPTEIPTGGCDILTKGSIGYRNETGRAAGEYRKIGTSVRKRPIWAEHWGSKNGPQVLVIGQVHGNECAPAFLVRELRANPPKQYGIWLIPTLNPDGLVAFTRENANGFDLNRDGFLLSQPETRALLAFTKEINPAISIHLHSPYASVGSFNGSRAYKVAERMSAISGLYGPSRAGTLKGTDRAFLWQGQARAVPGHQSVLVEFPAISRKEATTAPDPSRTRYASVSMVRGIAAQLRIALGRSVRS